MSICVNGIRLDRGKASPKSQWGPTLQDDLLRRCRERLGAGEFFLRANGEHVELFSVLGERGAASDCCADFLKAECNGLLNIKHGLVYEFKRGDAVRYFLRAAVGVTREGEFQGSVQAFRKAFEAARKLGLIGPNLSRLYQRGLWLSEKVRLALHQHKNAITPQSVVTDLAQKIFGDLRDHSALVLGNPAMSRAFVEKLQEKRIGNLHLSATNGQPPETGESGLSEMRIAVRQIPDALVTADILLVLDSELETFLETVDISKIMTRRKNAPLLFITGRDEVSEPVKRSDLNDIYNVYYYSSFDLDRIVAANLREHQKIAQVVDTLVEAETDDFLHWAQSKEWFRYGNIIGKSQAMQNIMELVARIAQTDISVLIDGESGTGKELVARSIHEHSARSDKKFVTVNCGAMTETLLESELFGHVRGAFTGAVANKKGLIEEANKGTIFLDEIGETSQSMQVKLLRFLQEGEIKPVGSTQTIKLDVRLIAATNRDLAKMVEEGSFRQDLYYRLNVIQVTVPPLRDRPEDILPLAEFFVSRYAKKFHKSILGLDDASQHALLAHSWPGNVRELENTIERALVLAPEKLIGTADLPTAVLAPAPTRSELLKKLPEDDVSLKEVEKVHIEAALNKHNWNYDLVAKLLGIGRTTLWRKMKLYDISNRRSTD